MAIAAILIAAAVGAAVRYLTKRDGLAIFIGGMTLPTLVIVGLVYWLNTMEVDDAPPGMVILGNMLLLVVITPLSFLGSFATIRILANASRSKVS